MMFSFLTLLIATSSDISFEYGGGDYSPTNLALAFSTSSSSSSLSRRKLQQQSAQSPILQYHLHSLKKERTNSMIALHTSSQDEANNAINNNNIDMMDFTSALCIIPPSWDRIQRARHYARDSLFQTWPPAIRLFHPFGGFIAPDGSGNGRKVTAFDVAQAIEELEIEPFDITFDNQWVIIPHYESIQQEMFTTNSNPEIEDHYSIEKHYQESDEDREVRELIEREEKLAKESYRKRVEKKRRKDAEAKKRRQQEEIFEREQQQQVVTGDESMYDLEENQAFVDDEEQRRQEEEEEEELERFTSTPKNNDMSPYDRYQSQQQFYEEAGSLGPCMLCLEPDEESKAKLIELRDSLQEFLSIQPNYFSPSSCYILGQSSSSNKVLHPELYEMGYRPLIPIGGIFESFPLAMDVARRLKGLWGDNNPLTFTVNELHLISCIEDNEAQDITGNDGFDDAISQGATGGENINNNPLYMIQRQQQERQYASIPWGCNAKIALMGQEKEQDDEFNQEQVNRLVEEGIAGGLDISEDFTILEDEDEDVMSELEVWLNDDDDFDEGMQVMIGRTTFYTGDQRSFKQMPVSSVVDRKDLSLGENSQKVSGMARRRRTSSRQTNAFVDGQYGRRDIDYLPWGKQERSHRDRNKVDQSDFLGAGLVSPSEEDNVEPSSSSASIPGNDDDRDDESLLLK